MKLFLAISLLTFSFSPFISQAAYLDIDSLKNALTKTNEVDERAKIYLALGNSYAFSGNDSSIVYYNKLLHIGVAQKNPEFYAKACLGLGRFHKYIDPVISTDYTIKAVEYGKMTDNHPLIGNAYRDLGNLYRYAGDLDKALEEYQNAEEVAISARDTLGLARSYNNIGIVYMMTDRSDLGLEYWQKGLELNLLIGKELSAAASMGNLAIHYMYSGNQEMAHLYAKDALDIDTRYQDFEAMTMDFAILGQIFTRMGNYPKAINAYNEAIVYADSAGAHYNKMEAYSGLIGVYDSLGRQRKALDYSRLYVELYVSNSSDKNERITRELTTKFETEKKEKENAKLKGDNETKDTRIVLEETNRIYLISGISLAAMVIVLVVFAIRRVRSAKKEIEFQKQLIEEKTHEITDSINYAKRLQTAILPTSTAIDKFFQSSFVLYQPKDIVAGDFYWMEEMDDGVLYAVADCTGHGVPGAMVSVVCHNALNRAVREYGLKKPGEILDKVTDLVIETFAKGNDEVKDGMDISLCSIKGNVIEYAGAQNPLWIIRKMQLKGHIPIAEEKDYLLYELKADKQPIGVFRGRKPFTTQKLELNPGDRLYMSTDGFPDQFGGADGKKLKTKIFKKLILSFSNAAVSDQKELLNNAFTEWKGSFEQLDDICVVGAELK